MNRLMSAVGRATTVWLLASWQNIVVIVLAVGLPAFQPIRLVRMQAAGKTMNLYTRRRLFSCWLLQLCAFDLPIADAPQMSFFVRYCLEMPRHGPGKYWNMYFMFGFCIWVVGISEWVVPLFVAFYVWSFPHHYRSLIFDTSHVVMNILKG